MNLVGWAKRSVPTLQTHPEEPRSGVSKDELHHGGKMFRKALKGLLTMRL